VQRFIKPHDKTGEVKETTVLPDWYDQYASELENQHKE
jgi:hypothetical protein